VTAPANAVADRLTVVCHGLVAAVRPADGQVLELIGPLLAMGAAPHQHGNVHATYTWSHAMDDAGHQLHVVSMRCACTPHRRRVARVRDPREAADLLARDLEYRAALHARDRLFVHAAAVAWHGRAILVPGRSFSGKTTLAAALVRQGAAYLSDEYAVLDEDGLVHPFPRPLRLRDATGAQIGRAHVEELGGTRGDRAVPVGLVLSTTHRDGAAWRPREMAPGEMALAMLANTVVARLRPAYALRVVARAVDGVVGLAGPRGDADETARSLLERASAAWAPGS